MPQPRWLPDLPFPLDHLRLVKQAMAYVRSFRNDQPHVLFRWDPEEPLPKGERPRRELAMALVLVQSLGTGSGSYESRMTACQKLYRLGKEAPGEAIRAGELLLRSRMVTGATDIETFWLATTFAHPTSALVNEPVAGLAWRYLTHAPFSIDHVTALSFAKLSCNHRFGLRPRWPWELSEALLGDVQHRELVISLLEAMLSIILKTPSIEQAAAKLPASPRFQTPLFKDVVTRLAWLYAEGNYESVYARDIAQQAADLGDERAAEWVEKHIFDVPYEELAKLVKAWLKGKSEQDLEAYYVRAVDSGKFHVARRLAELELVMRMTDWKKGPMYPHLEEAIQTALKGKIGEEDPRVRELLLRTGILYSRTRHYTPAARMLLRRLSQDSELLGDGELVPILRDEFLDFVRACDPYNTLSAASQAMEKKLETLDADARSVLEDVKSFLFTRVRPQQALLSRSIETIAQPFNSDDRLGLLLEGTLRSIHALGLSLINEADTKRAIAAQAGVPWPALHKVSVRRLRDIAKGYARMDQIVAASGGAIAGLLGGPWGAAIDLGSLFGTAARSVARIGLCFGISPTSDPGKKLLADSLLLAGSTSGGEGLIAMLREEPERKLRPIIIGGICYSGEQIIRWAPGTTAAAISIVARQLGFSWTEQRIARMIPLMGAVLSAGADYLFLRQVTQAAVHLGARHFLLTPASPLSAQSRRS